MYADYENNLVITNYAQLKGKVRSTSDKLIINKKQTAEQSANKIIATKVNTYTQEGYNTDLEFVQAHKFNCHRDGTPKPMLLLKIDNPTNLNNSKALKKVIAKNKYFYLDPKLDGFRCNAVKGPGDEFCKLISRFGNSFELSYIQEEVNILFNQIPNITDKIFFDGELYSHGTFLGDIGSLIRQGAEGLKYVIYDFGIEGYTYEQRMSLVRDLFANCKSELKHIEVVNSVLCHTTEDVITTHNHHVQLGYEGSVLKIPEAFYEFSFRSSSVLKIKPRETDEFLCVGGYSRKLEDQFTLRLETKEGKVFSARYSASDELRRKMKEEFEDKWLGQFVTIEYRKINPATGIPIEAVALGLRSVEREQIDYSHVEENATSTINSDTTAV